MVLKVGVLLTVGVVPVVVEMEAVVKVLEQLTMLPHHASWSLEELEEMVGAQAAGKEDES